MHNKMPVVKLATGILFSIVMFYFGDVVSDSFFRTMIRFAVGQS